MKSHRETQRSLRRASIPPALEHVLSSDLENAINRAEIEMLFQPQFAASSGAMIGAEALARWHHPVLGEISARDLFAVAERGETVELLSRHVVALALREAASWRSDMRISVNITPEEIANPGFASQLESTAVQAGVLANRITIEITEDALLGDIERSAPALQVLADRGFRIALDDFGAGFCNFLYLKRLPVHSLKLDRTMLRGVTRGTRDLAVLRAMIALAEALELETVAEGIETEAQRQVIVEEGCTAWQGFLWAEPIGARQMRTLAGV